MIVSNSGTDRAEHLLILMTSTQEVNYVIQNQDQLRGLYISNEGVSE